MVVAILSTYLVMHLALLGWSFTFVRPASPRLWILRLLLGGMVYDNLTLLLGGMIYDNLTPTGGDLAIVSPWYLTFSIWYSTASIWRFVLHAALLPLLVPFALSALRASGAPIARRPWFVAGCWLIALGAWCYGFWYDLGGLALQTVLGHQRYVAFSALPPFGTIAVNLLLIPLAFILWRRSGWYLMLFGALFILLVNGALGSQPWGFIAGNGAEVVFILCLLLTERFLVRGQEPVP